MSGRQGQVDRPEGIGPTPCEYHNCENQDYCRRRFACCEAFARYVNEGDETIPLGYKSKYNEPEPTRETYIKVFQTPDKEKKAGWGECPLVLYLLAMMELEGYAMEKDF